MRHLALAPLVLLFSAGPAPAQPAPTLAQRIEALRMVGGHLPDAYLDNPKAAGLCWYFSTIGVHARAAEGGYDQSVRAYLDRYLSTATLPGGAIDDVADLTKPAIVRRVADSDDSYAGAVLSLACWYAGRGRDGAAWFQKNLPRLEFIATANLLDNTDPKTKLTNTFNNQPRRFAERGQEKAPYQHVGLLMDNCEAYRGLKDFADLLAKLKHKEAGKYAKGAARVAEGVAGLYDSPTKAFRVGTADAGAVKFYPHRLVQVAPQVYGVDLGQDTQAMYTAAWDFVNAGGDQWWTGQIKDGSNKGAPFMILSYAAALRGDRVKAAAHLKYFQATLQEPKTPPEFGNIGELGFALRGERQLRQKK